MQPAVKQHCRCNTCINTLNTLCLLCLLTCRSRRLTALTDTALDNTCLWATLPQRECTNALDTVTRLTHPQPQLLDPGTCARPTYTSHLASRNRPATLPVYSTAPRTHPFLCAYGAVLTQTVTYFARQLACWCLCFPHLLSAPDLPLLCSHRDPLPGQSPPPTPLHIKPS